MKTRTTRSTVSDARCRRRATAKESHPLNSTSIVVSAAAPANRFARRELSMPAIEAARAECLVRDSSLVHLQVLRFAPNTFGFPGAFEICVCHCALLRESGFAGVLLNTGSARILSHRFEFALACCKARAQKWARFSPRKASHEPPRVPGHRITRRHRLKSVPLRTR